MGLSATQRFDLIWFGIALVGGILIAISDGQRWLLARREPERFLVLEHKRLGKSITYRKLLVRLTLRLIADLFWITFSLAEIVRTLSSQ